MILHQPKKKKRTLGNKERENTSIILNLNHGTSVIMFYFGYAEPVIIDFISQKWI